MPRQRRKPLRHSYEHTNEFLHVAKSILDICRFSGILPTVVRKGYFGDYEVRESRWASACMAFVAIPSYILAGLLCWYFKEKSQTDRLVMFYYAYRQTMAVVIHSW